MRFLEALARVAAAVSVGIGRIVLTLVGALAILEATRVADLGGLLWTWPVAFLALAVTHEWCHVIAIFSLGGALEDVCRGSAGVELGFRSLGRRSDVVVVVAGPVGAAATGLTVAFACSLAHGPPTVAAGFAVIGVGHVASLLAPLGDGAELRRLMARSVRGARGQASGWPIR